MSEFTLAGSELSWPIMTAPGLTNHPDIEQVANLFDMYTSIGLGGVALGGWKLGEASGGNGYRWNPDLKSWDYFGGDEYADIENGAFFNAKGLPGPGTDQGLERMDDFIDMAWGRGVEVTLNLSPHTAEPLKELEELIEVGRKSLNKGVLLVEFNLSCPNIPGRPAFYKDRQSVAMFLDMMDRSQPLTNRYGMPGAYLKYGPTEPGERIVFRRAQGVGGVILSNTLGNQEPKKSDGSPAIAVNEGKAGMSGPALESLGREQLQNNSEIDGEVISALGVSHGEEVKRRLELGARAVQIASVLYCPELIGCETPAEVAGQIKNEFVQAMAA